MVPKHQPVIWVNYNISLTWILLPFGDDVPKINHDSRARENSEVVMKFTQSYGSLLILRVDRQGVDYSTDALGPKMDHEWHWNTKMETR